MMNKKFYFYYFEKGCPLFVSSKVDYLLPDEVTQNGQSAFIVL